MRWFTDRISLPRLDMQAGKGLLLKRCFFALLFMATIAATQLLYGDTAGGVSKLHFHVQAMGMFAVLSLVSIGIMLLAVKLLIYARQDKSRRWVFAPAGLLFVGAGIYLIKSSIIDEPAVWYAWRLVAPYALALLVCFAPYLVGALKQKERTAPKERRPEPDQPPSFPPMARPPGRSGTAAISEMLTQ